MHRRSIITHAGQLRPHPREDTRVLLEEYGGAPEEQAKCVRAAHAVSCRGDQHGHQARTTDEREPMSTITIDRLTKRYGAVCAVDDLSFSLEPGPSPASSAPTAPASRRRCGCCWASPGRRPAGRHRGTSLRRAPDTPRSRRRTPRPRRLPPETHLAETRCGSWPAPAASRTDESTRSWSSSTSAAAADRRVNGYSMGMRQRLGLAAALLGDRRILVLDEPANGLDPMGVRWLRTLLRDLADEGRHSPGLQSPARGTSPDRRRRRRHRPRPARRRRPHARPHHRGRRHLA